jgi:hypothetical protein
METGNLATWPIVRAAATVPRGGLEPNNVVLIGPPCIVTFLSWRLSQSKAGTSAQCLMALLKDSCAAAMTKMKHIVSLPLQLSHRVTAHLSTKVLICPPFSNTLAAQRSPSIASIRLLCQFESIAYARHFLIGRPVRCPCPLAPPRIKVSARLIETCPNPQRDLRLTRRSRRCPSFYARRLCHTPAIFDFLLASHHQRLPYCFFQAQERLNLRPNHV